MLCWVLLGTVLSKRRCSSSSVFGGRNRRTPLSSSKSTFAIQMYHCKCLRQFKEIIARKLHKYSISNDNLFTNIQKFPKQHLISLESTRHAHVCCMHAFVTQWRYYYKVFISQVVYNFRGVLYGPLQSLAFGSRL